MNFAWNATPIATHDPRVGWAMARCFPPARGADAPALVEGDILGPSEAFRGAFDYFSHTKRARQHLDKLAATAPRTLACMHGSAWTGDGATLLIALADALDG